MKICVRITFVFLFFITLNVYAQSRASEALAEYRAGNYERTIQICRDDISENPNSMESHVIICWALMRQSRYEEALRFARAGRAINRFDVRILQIMGEIHYFQGLNNEALQYFQEYVSITPEGQRVETIYYYMGEIFIRQGKFRHADIALSTAVHWVPGNAAWWVRLAYARENTGDLSSALEAYEKALSLNAQLSDAQRGLDRIRRTMGGGGAQTSYSVQSQPAAAPATPANTQTRPNLTGSIIINNAMPGVGDTLIASYTGNGSGTAVWQWLADETVITGANTTSYVVGSNDLNRTIRARVSYSGQSGNVTSAATRAVTTPVTRPNLTGNVTINNSSPRVGDSITASYTGNGSGTAVWQWLANDTIINGANSNTYVVGIGDVEKTIRARVSYTNQNGNITSAATRTIARANLTGNITIDNTAPRLGDVITAAYTGNGTGTVNWQWLRNDNVINGAVGRTYTVGNEDIGKTLKARVSHADFNGNVTSSATSSIARAALTGEITLSVTAPKLGDAITAVYTGNGTGTVNWQWMRNNSVIRGATSNTYTAGASDVGRTLKVKVSYADQSNSITSETTAIVTRE